MLEERDDIVVCFFFHFANVLYYYCNIIFLRPIFLVNHRHKVLALSVKPSIFLLSHYLILIFLAHA